MTACLWIICIAASAFIAGGASAQVIIPSPAPPDGGPGDLFRSLGIDGDGQVWILGDCRNDCENDQVLFRFTGEGFESMPLSPLPNMYRAEARRISRDGQYIVGSSERYDSEEPTLWSLRESLVPRSLGPLLDCCPARPQDVASTPEGPFVVGRYGFGTFLWGEGTGYQAWMTNSDFLPLRWTFVVSADGAKWAGDQLSLSGSNIVSLPFVGTETTLEILETKGSSNCRAFAISPNGNYITGLIDRQPVLWTKKRAEILSFGTNVTALWAVTDSGYAGGASPGDVGGGVIYNSHGRKLELFDHWWGKNYPDVPLPDHVIGVLDLYEYGGNLYCLIRFLDEVTGFHISALAIAPLKGGSK